MRRRTKDNPATYI